MNTAKQPTRLYLALDLETTGLDPVKDKILEVGWRILDENLFPYAPAVSQIVWPNDFIWSAFNRADTVVKAMHTKSGLLTEMTEASSGVTPNLAGIERRLMADLRKATNGEYDNGQIPVHLLGFSVHFDRSFIDRHMPTLSKRLHHRILDASSLKLLAEAYDIPAIEVHNPHPHRAAFDVDESIDYVNQFARLLALEEF